MHVRKQRNIPPKSRVREYLPGTAPSGRRELELWLDAGSRPLLVLSWMEVNVMYHGSTPAINICELQSLAIRARRKNILLDMELRTFHEEIHLILSALHACEKIRNTPIPFP